MLANRKKTKNRNGDKAYKVFIPVLVTKEVLTIALCEYYYSANADPETFKLLKQKEAFNILQSRLALFGKEGEYPAIQIAKENVREYEIIFNAAEAWVIKNYPYLNQ
jgi:hypothetical protein